MLTTQELIASLGKGGLPISAGAEAMRLETTSIYSWRSGGEMRSAQTQRAAQLHRLFTTVAGVDVRSLLSVLEHPRRWQEYSL